MSRVFTVLLAIMIAALAIPLSNELIGGIWSESRLYSHALVTGDQSDPDQMAYIFGQVQIVHDARWREPIRLVRFTPYGGTQIVIYDREVGDAWSVEVITVELDRVFEELTAEVRARIADSMLQQVLHARDGGAEAALSIASTGSRPYIDWYRSDGTGPDPGVLQAAQPMVLEPGLQVWYPKLGRFVVVWLLLTGFGIWMLRRVTRQMGNTAE